MAIEISEESNKIEPLRLLKDQLVDHVLDTEYARICRNPVDGVYIIPSALDKHEWFGVIFIRRGVYIGGIFRFTLRIPEEFPETKKLPVRNIAGLLNMEGDDKWSKVVIFDLEVFHPLVDLKTRQLDLNRFFPDGWKADKHHLYNVLVVVQRIFFSLDADFENSGNAEAAILWKEHKDKFREIAKERVNQSRAQVYDDPVQSQDPNAIRFTPWDSSVHEAIRDKMLRHGRENVSAEYKSGKQSGYSWVDVDRMTYMTESISTGPESDADRERAATTRAVHGIERLDLSGVSESPRDQEEDDVESIDLNSGDKRENATDAKENHIIEDVIDAKQEIVEDVVDAEKHTTKYVDAENQRTVEVEHEGKEIAEENLYGEEGKREEVEDAEKYRTEEVVDAENQRTEELEHEGKAITEGNLDGEEGKREEVEDAEKDRTEEVVDAENQRIEEVEHDGKDITEGNLYGEEGKREEVEDAEKYRTEEVVDAENQRTEELEHEGKAITEGNLDGEEGKREEVEDVDKERTEENDQKCINLQHTENNRNLLFDKDQESLV